MNETCGWRVSMTVKRVTGFGKCTFPGGTNGSRRLRGKIYQGVSSLRNTKVLKGNKLWKVGI